jgi:hypothetical protein
VTGAARCGRRAPWCEWRAPDLPQGPRAGGGRPRPRVSPVTSAKCRQRALSLARCERVTAVAGADRRAPAPEEPAPDLPRGFRAVAGRRRPRVSHVTPARSARGRGNALFEHVFRSCRSHSAAAELESISKLKRLHCLRSLMFQSGALAADDTRCLWGPHSVIIGSNSQGNCDYVL